MKKLRVILLVHSTLMPPDDLHDPEDPRMEKVQTEYDVMATACPCVFSGSSWVMR